MSFNGKARFLHKVSDNTAQQTQQAPLVDPFPLIKNMFLYVRSPCRPHHGMCAVRTSQALHFRFTGTHSLHMVFMRALCWLQRC